MATPSAIQVSSPVDYSGSVSDVTDNDPDTYAVTDAQVDGWVQLSFNQRISVTKVLLESGSDLSLSGADVYIGGTLCSANLHIGEEQEMEFECIGEGDVLLIKQSRQNVALKILEVTVYTLGECKPLCAVPHGVS